MLRSLQSPDAAVHGVTLLAARTAPTVSAARGGTPATPAVFDIVLGRNRRRRGATLVLQADSGGRADPSWQRARLLGLAAAAAGLILVLDPMQIPAVASRCGKSPGPPSFLALVDAVAASRRPAWQPVAVVVSACDLLARHQLLDRARAWWEPDAALPLALDLIHQEDQSSMFGDWLQAHWPEAFTRCTTAFPCRTFAGVSGAGPVAGALPGRALDPLHWVLAEHGLVPTARGAR
jgi:hypothetical protein